MTRVRKERKVTGFLGRADGDYECFCFDTRYAEQVAHDESLTDRTRWRRAEQARLYPGDFIPAKALEARGRGKWIITVEWTPVEAEPNGTSHDKGNG